jgi:DNA modification methylase
MQKNLAHKTVVDDSIYCGVASADYLLIFRKRGDNEIPIAHPTGLDYYAGERPIPEELLSYRGYKGNQIENRYSHWIWRQYASSFWDDVRLDHVLPYREGRDEDDEKHVHPLQLDVIDRVVILRSNPGEVVFTPFMGVGSEVFSAVMNDRKGIGFELKESYFRQAVKNMQYVDEHKRETKELNLFDGFPENAVEEI